MADYVNVTLRNSTINQLVYHATDDTLGEQVLQNTPLAAGEGVGIRLVADANGHGQMTYGYRGGVDTRSGDLNDGDVVNG